MEFVYVKYYDDYIIELFKCLIYTSLSDNLDYDNNAINLRINDEKAIYFNFQSLFNNYNHEIQFSFDLYYMYISYSNINIKIDFNENVINDLFKLVELKDELYSIEGDFNNNSTEKFILKNMLNQLSLIDHSIMRKLNLYIGNDLIEDFNIESKFILTLKDIIEKKGDI